MAIALEERPRESEPDIRLPKGPMWITPRVTDISPLSPAVDEYLIDHRSELVDFAETLVGFDTQNPPGRTVEVTERLESILAGTSLDVNRIEVDPEKPYLVATLAGASDRTLCFNGDLDTVPFDRSDWSRDPLGERVDGRVYGRGATEMKGAVAAMLQMALARRVSISPNCGESRAPMA